MNQDELNEKCKAAIDHFKKDAAKLRTGRVQTNILDGIMVDAYGSSMPLKQVAVVNAGSEPRALQIQAYDAQITPAIEKAIQSSDLGLNPSRDGGVLRVWIPPLTEDRRKEAVRSLHKLAEEGRVVMRSYRKDCIDSLKEQQKAKEISEDDFYRGQDAVQKTIDSNVKKLDDLMQKKEAELMEV